MNYYPFHIGDYLSATRHLSWEEDAAYRRLLDTYYTTEKPLPADLRAVCRLVLATTDSQREAVKVVLDEFFALTQEGWVNSRADREIAAMRERQQKQRDKANKRWQKQAATSGNALAMPRHGEADAAALKADADAMPPTPTPTPERETRAKREPPSGQALGCGERLPQDWKLPAEWRAWAAEQRPDLDIDLVAESFADHWHSVPDDKGLRVDWLPVWRKWVREERPTAQVAAMLERVKNPLRADGYFDLDGEVNP